MIAIPIFQTVCFSLYLWYIVYHFGVIQSISQSWYEEENVNGKRKKFMFALFIASLSVPTVLLYTKSLWFIGSGVSLGIVGFAPAFRSERKIVGILHTGGTVGGIALACYALATHGIYFPAIGCAIVSILLDRLKVPNATFWQEIGDVAFIELGVYELITLGL